MSLALPGSAVALPSRAPASTGDGHEAWEAMAALSSEPPYLIDDSPMANAADPSAGGPNTCGGEPDYATSLSTERICALTSVPELLAWTFGADRDCRDAQATAMLRHESRLLDQHIQRRVRAARALLELSPTDRTYVLEAYDYSPSKYAALIAYASLQSSLSPPEKLLAYAYFQNGYLRMNPILRAGGPAAKCLSPLDAAMTATLRRAPPHIGQVWRGIRLPEAQAQQYQPGREFTWTAYSSTSADREVAESYAAHPAGGQIGLLFSLQSRTCVDARGLSDKFWENEITCLPGTRVRVLRREPPNVVVLEEIAPTA